VQILVRDNNVDQALRALKKKLQREGVYREMKLRRHYEKPSEKRAREKAAAVRRARKLERSAPSATGEVSAGLQGRPAGCSLGCATASRLCCKIRGPQGLAGFVLLGFRRFPATFGAALRPGAIAACAARGRALEAG
jgi:small subunit ribosomal protein S21